MKYRIIYFGIIYFFSVFCPLSPVFASYTLPYPSFMPGNTLYRVSKIMDKLKEYWAWGDIAQFKYHLGLADKYLVESKTLFEYGQYMLALQALNASNCEFVDAQKAIVFGKEHGKDMTVYENLLKDSGQAHSMVITNAKKYLPKTYTWAPEKQNPSELDIYKAIDSAIELRLIK